MTLDYKLSKKLSEIYQGEQLDEAMQRFEKLLIDYKGKKFPKIEELSEKNVYLITYGDSFENEEQLGLDVLFDIIEDKLYDTITDIHLLPMFPYTSDDGFSVTEYEKISPPLGDWNSLKKLANEKRIMFDFVANHMSKNSSWFKKFLSGTKDFKEAFVEFDKDFDTSKVIRPRISDLFHSYESGKKVWTTFSEDQVDINFKDVEMFIRMTKVLLNYVLKGASSIRLDAIGFIWKESGSTCMHLPQVHAIIQLWRLILDEFAPKVQIITETNVPHQENIKYFGNGINEASQVYQFPLPPLVLHTFIEKNCSKLTEWAKNIKHISSNATYFNFLASHDGIGLRPTEGILTDKERERIIKRVVDNDGLISYKNNSDGTQSVYELNINYSEALKELGKEYLTPKKMVAAHHILLSFIGVPAIYFHSIFGSRNDLLGVENSGINRRINRQILNKEELYNQLTFDSYRKEIYKGIQNLIKVRKNEQAFNPYGNQTIIDFDSRVFILERSFQSHKVVAVTNISEERVYLKSYAGQDLISGKYKEYLDAYDVVWIKKI